METPKGNDRTLQISSEKDGRGYAGHVLIVSYTNGPTDDAFNVQLQIDMESMSPVELLIGAVNLLQEAAGGGMPDWVEETANSIISKATKEFGIERNETTKAADGSDLQ